MQSVEDRSAEKQLLEKLLAERAELDLLITALRKRLGAATEPQPDSFLVPESSAITVMQGEFFGLSRAEAAIALLRKVRRTLSTNEIFQTLKESGLDMSGKNTLSALYTSLSRHPELRKVARNTWGLREWYPHLKDNKKRNGNSQEINEAATDTKIEFSRDAAE